MPVPMRLDTSLRSTIPGGFESEGDEEEEEENSPTKTIFDDARSMFTHSRNPSAWDVRVAGPDEEDEEASRMEGGSVSLLNESEAARHLRDVESSFMPDLSHAPPDAIDEEGGSSMEVAVATASAPPWLPGCGEEGGLQTQNQQSHANTSSLETMSSSPTAAAAARTISRVVSMASMGGYETAEEESTMEYGDETRGDRDLTPKKNRDKARINEMEEPPSPSPAKPLPSGDLDGLRDSGIGDLDAKPTPRRRPRYLNSRFASQRSSYSSQTSASADASELTVGADYALQTGGGQALSTSLNLRGMSRSISLGSMASGISKLNESETDDNGLVTLPEDGVLSASDANQYVGHSPVTPRLPSVLSTNTPTDTVINQRIQNFDEIPGTVMRKFYDAERNASPERKAAMPTPAGSRVKALSLKEQSSLIDKLQKENWKLKLKLYFMDQTIAERSDESVKAMISENVELKTLKFSNTKEIRNLKRSIRELEYKLKERDETIAKQREAQPNTTGLSDHSQDLEAEMVYLRERVESYEIEIDKLRTDNATKEGEKRRLAEMINLSGDRSRIGSDGGAREEVQMWKELLETETARKEQADEENRKLRDEIWELKKQAAGHLQPQSDSARDISGDTASESTLVEQLRHENAELRREVSAQTSMLTSRNREKERLYQEIEDLKMGQRRSDGRSDILDRSISRAHVRSSSRTSSQTRVTTIGDAEREMYETRNGQLRDDISRLKLENQQLAEEMEKLLDELDAIGNTREALDQLQKRFDDLTEDTNQEILAMQRERDEALQGQERVELDFQDLKVEAQERIDALEDELDQTTEAMKQLEEELASRDEETKALRNEVRMTSEGLDKVEADVQQKMRRIKELELEIEEITTELEGIEKTSIETNAKNEKLLVELESRQSECAFLREEQDGYVMKFSELENKTKMIAGNLSSEREKVRELEKRLAEERHQREVIGGKKEQEQQRIMNELNREASTARDDARKLRKVVETRDMEVRTWKERHFDLEATIKDVLGDPNGSKASFATAIARLQQDLTKAVAELGSARDIIGEREQLIQRRDGLLESHALESRKLTDLLEKERNARRSEKLQHEQWQNMQTHTSQTVTQKDKRIQELETGRSADRKKLNRQENEFREQLAERNSLLLTLWNKASALCGPDWTHQNSLVSGHLPTVDVVANMLPGFSKNLLFAIKTLEANVTGFRTRVKQLDRDLAKDYRQIEEQLHVRLKRLDRLESAVQLSRVSSAASAAPEIAKLRGENKLLRTEMESLRKQTHVRAARSNAVTIEPSDARQVHSRADSASSPRPPSRKTSLNKRTGESSSSGQHTPRAPSASLTGPAGAGSLQDLGPLPGDAETAAMTAMVQNEPGQARWIHRLRELERRLKAEREARLLDRSGARKRLEEGRQENALLKAELERERERRRTAAVVSAPAAAAEAGE